MRLAVSSLSRLAVVASLTVLLGASASPHAIGQDAAPDGDAARPKVEFFPDLAAAQKAPDDDRPIAILFGATWCGWCRKLKDESLAAAEVAPSAAKFAWVEVDVDDEPELTARHRARGLPHLVVLDRTGVERATHTGFLKPAGLAKFLATALDPAAAESSPSDPASAAPPTPAEIAERDDAKLKEWEGLAAGDVGPAVVREVVELLARPDRPRREAALKLLRGWKEAATPGLLAALDDERLAVRAAASQALRLASAKDLPFDPFAEPEARREQAAAWRAALGSSSESAPAASPATVEALDPAADAAAAPTNSPPAGR